MRRVTLIESPARLRMLQRGVAFISLLSLFFFAPARASEQQPAFPTRIQLPEQTLHRCGTGTAKAYRVFKVAKSAFYRTDCNLPWQIDRLEGRLLRFDYVREVPAHAFQQSALTMLQRNLTLTPDQLRQIEQFHLAYLDVKEGDSYSLQFASKTGLVLSLNKKVLARLEDKWLALRYFSIWLGEKPFDDRLKQSLLGY